MSGDSIEDLTVMLTREMSLLREKKAIKPGPCSEAVVAALARAYRRGIATGRAETLRTSSRTLREAKKLLRSASAHVFRQQFAGKHEQDRADAVDLYPKIDGFLQENDR